MQYARYEDYVEYREGLDPIIEPEEWPYWERQARAELDHLTFNRVRTLTAVPDEVKECISVIAELLHTADKLTQASTEQGIAGTLVSYSNDGQSGSFDISAKASKYSESGRKAEIARLARLYLGNTGLLYAGVRHYES